MISSPYGPMDSIHLLDIRNDRTLWHIGFDGHLRIIQRLTCG